MVIHNVYLNRVGFGCYRGGDHRLYGAITCHYEVITGYIIVFHSLKQNSHKYPFWDLCRDLEMGSLSGVKMGVVEHLCHKKKEFLFSIFFTFFFYFPFFLLFIFTRWVFFFFCGEIYGQKMHVYWLVKLGWRVQGCSSAIFVAKYESFLLLLLLLKQ